MRLATSLLLSLSVLTASPSAAATIHVPGTHSTIQGALNASTSGDLILVGSGVYTENVVLTAARNGVRLESSSGPATTIIDGGAAGCTMRILAGVTSSTEIRGFTIRNGYTLSPGGGVYIEYASPMLIDCIIEQNFGTAGAGVYVDQGSPTFQFCTIRDNDAPFGSGGGLYADHVGVTTLFHCLVYGNECGAYGGGLTAWEHARVVLDHTTVADNAAALAGGNLYFTRSGRFDATASIIAFPASNSNIHAALSPGTSSFVCCDLYVAGGLNVVGFASPIGTSGNFELDPGFCDLGADHFGLTANSPCASIANTNNCGQVGALDVACGVVSASKRSWGALKSTYR